MSENEYIQDLLGQITALKQQVDEERTAKEVLVAEAEERANRVSGLLAAADVQYAELHTQGERIIRQVKMLTATHCADYPRRDMATIWEHLWAIEQVLHGRKLALNDMHVRCDALAVERDRAITAMTTVDTQPIDDICEELLKNVTAHGPDTADNPLRVALAMLRFRGSQHMRCANFLNAVRHAASIPRTPSFTMEDAVDMCVPPIFRQGQSNGEQGILEETQAAGTEAAGVSGSTGDDGAVPPASTAGATAT